MAELIRVPSEAGGSLTVEVDARDVGVVKAARPEQVVAEATQTLEAALASLVPGATAVVNKLRAAKPSEVSLSFGIKLTAEARRHRPDRGGVQLRRHPALAGRQLPSVTRPPATRSSCTKSGSSPAADAPLRRKRVENNCGPVVVVDGYGFVSPWGMTAFPFS